MKVNKKDLEKSQVELTVELSWDEFKPYLEKGAAIVSKEVKVEGFRPGKVPYDVLKNKIGEMTILEESARIAINEKIKEALDKHLDVQGVGQPQVDITKLAPENPMEFTVVIALLPEITLGDYKGLNVKQEKVELDEKDVEKMLEDLREMRVQEKVSLSELQKGDKAVVDIHMFLDNVPVEGGQGKDTAIILGKDYILKGFDKQLLGMKKAETREFKLPYPEDYHQKNLAGKMVDFKVEVKETYKREKPEVDDTFALGFGTKTAAELKENIKKSLVAQRENETKQKAELKMLEKLIANAKFGDIPEVLLTHEVEGMLGELEQSIAQQGGKFDDYLNHLKKTKEQLKLDMMPEAVKRVKTSLLVREVGKKENVKVSDKDVDKQIEDTVKHYKEQGQTDEKILKEYAGGEYRAYVANVLTSRKVIDSLREWNIKE